MELVVARDVEAAYDFKHANENCGHLLQMKPVVGLLHG